MAITWVLGFISAAVISSSAAERVSLFDGESFAGWEGDTNKWWRIEQGAIVGGSLAENVPHNDFLATTRDFTNFVLRFQFKLLGSRGFINSGVQIRSQRVPNSHEMAGYQCDIGDPTWWGSIYDEARRNRVMAQSDMEAINKVLKRGEWNEYEIRAEGRRIRTYINGVLGVDYTEADESIVQWGKIGIQIHGGGAAEAWFKDITIEKLPSPKESPLSPEEQRASFRVPEGFVVELVASEPELPKPVTVTWDEAGRMWAITAVEYPVDANENPERAEALFRGGGRDRIVVFDPIPAGGDASARGGALASASAGYGPARVFADGLVMPLGVLPYRDGALVQYGSEVLYLRDTDGDGRADRREVVLSGFGIQDSHLFPHQFTRAPGGWIYLAQGAFNYSRVRTTDGVVVQYDQTKLARFRPDGSAFEVLTHGPCNIWGLVINETGETFIQEANDYGYPVIHFQPGINVPGCGDRLFKPYAPRHPSIADFRMGGTGLSGLAWSEEAATFPEPWHEVMFVANPIVGQVQAVKIHREGSGYRLERLADFVSSADEWFRPVAIHFGPDGALYIVDWYNKIISHNEVPRDHPERDKTRGRVWRVRHEGAPRRAIPDVARAEDASLLKHLRSDSGWEWRAAWQQIGDRNARELKPALEEMAVREETAARRIRALWALESLGEVQKGVLDELAGSSDRNVRREAVRVAGHALAAEEALRWAAALAEDADHQVRAEVIRAVSGQVAPWQHLILEGADKRPDRRWSGEAVGILLGMAKPALAEAHRPGPGYERAFERYLIRAALERHPSDVAAFLDSPAASALPVDRRRFACLALDGARAARVLAELMREERFDPADEEWILLQRHHPRGDWANVYPIYPWVELLGAAVRQRDAIQLEADREWIENAARVVLKSEYTPEVQEERMELALQAVRTYRLENLEPLLARHLAESRADPKRQTALLQAWRELPPREIGPILELASRESASGEVRQAAVEALAASRNPAAGRGLLALWPVLDETQRRSLVDQLSSTKSGGETLLAALDRGVLLTDELPVPALEKMRTLLGEDARMERWWREAADRMTRVLRLEGNHGDYVSTKIALKGPFTVETWIKLDAGINNHDGILGQAGSADLNFYDERFRFFAGNDHRDVVVAGRKISAGSWTHLAVTRDGEGEFRIYVNGELDAVGTKRTMDAFEGLDVGRTIPGAGGTSGELAEYRVWDRARTAEEILANFDRSLAGGSSLEGLVYHFHGQEKAGGPLRGRARVEGTLDGPSLMTAEEARAVREKFERFQQLTQTRGRVEAGRALFETACLVCHQVGGQGSNLAPPLDGAGHRGTEGLLRALLTPSAAVEAGYRKFQVETRDGEIHDGFLVARDAGEIILRQPNAGELRLEADTVKRARFTRLSLMPEGLLEAMTPEEVSDLFAFLRTLH